MDKRTITALLMMLVLYLLFDHFVWKPQRDNARQAIQSEEVVPESPISNAPDSLSAAALPTVNADSLFSSSTEAQFITLENENIIVKFNSRGAVINSIELKHFDFGPESKVDLIPEQAQILNT
ncbi:MAG TPA: hypothetical protein DG355_06370, partial [Candidatus Cloacimonas sp.]|nr:hypothetical protein [Candidatus Cloacimonas sp.]